MKSRLPLLLVLLLAPVLHAEQITVATYNIEHFSDNFLSRRIAATRPSATANPDVKELLDSQRRHEDEENWEVSQVILDPKFSPDILAIQEGCSQAELEQFNQRWLKNAYATVIVFNSNTDRGQTVGMMLKPGFKVIQRRDQYHTEPDPTNRGNRLFARGPAFVLVESPSGYRFWAGTNHQKSKSDNSVEVTQWRNREAKRTHQIIKEIERTGPNDVMFVGDMNDEIGIQMYEMQGGGDAMANLVGPATDGFFLVTGALANAGKISYFGYSRTDYRSLIDHIIVTRNMKDQIDDVAVFQNDFTAVASDHCPVVVKFRADPKR